MTADDDNREINAGFQQFALFSTVQDCLSFSGSFSLESEPLLADRGGLACSPFNR
jgi:hypothetical protein